MSVCVGGGGAQVLRSLKLMTGLVYFPSDFKEKLLTNGKLMNRQARA